MKILFFSRLFYPHVGGVEKHVERISEELIKKGHSVTVVTEQYDNKLPEKEEYKGIQIFRIPINTSEKKKKFVIWKWLRKHQNLIKEADIVHCHDVFYWYLPFRFRYPRKPIFTTFHGYETAFPPAKAAVRMRKIAEKLSFGNICVGDFITKWYGTKPTYVTYGGVDKIQSLKLKNVNHNSKIKILFIGRLEKDNGIEIYLDAIEKLKKEKNKLEFTVAGDGTYRKTAEKFGNVLGFVNPTKVISENNIIFSSSYLSMLDALVQKKVVIATYTNQLKEDYLKMSPFARFILIAKDSEEISNLITTVKQDSWKYNSMVENGYKWAKEQTWEKVADLYLRLWKI